MVPLLLIILTISVPIIILKPFRPFQKFVVLLVILAHLSVILGWHEMVLRREGTPIVRSTNVDAWRYYYRTSSMEGQKPYSITRHDIIGIAGGNQHLGYWYLNAIAHTLTSRPVLAIRLFKVLLFFTGLACVMRVWRRNYGNGLSIFGFIFMTILFLTPLYYNFINYKDSLMLGLFLLCMALLDTLLRPVWQLDMPRKKIKSILGWALLVFLLWVMTTMRIYYSIAIVFGIAMHLLTRSGINAKLRISLMFLLGLGVLYTVRSRLGSDISSRIGQIEGYFPIYSIFKGIFTPLPWQYFIRGLISSHCFYLLLIPFAIVAFFAHFRKNLTWHFYTLAILVYALGTVLDAGSADRKRIIIVPILLMWVLSYFAYRKGSHIEQTPLEDEQAFSEEIYEYDHQIE